MIYTRFKQWVNGPFPDTGEPRYYEYSKNELALIEMGWNYGYDAGVQWQKTQQALDKIVDNERELNIQMQPEPVAFLHEIVASDGEPDQALSFSPENFPSKGVYGFKSVSVKTLVFASDTSQERVDEMQKQRHEQEPVQIKSCKTCLYDEPRTKTCGAPHGCDGESGWKSAQPEPEPQYAGTARELFTNAAIERLDVRPSTKVYLGTPSVCEQPARRQEPVIDKSAATRIATSLGWEPKRKPLTDEEIILIVADCASSYQLTDIHFARAIEAAHGIKE